MKKKWTIVAFSICITIVVGLIATIIVLASGTQGVGTSVSVLYVATDIEGTVSAKYSKVNKNTGTVISTTDMVTSSGSKTVSFLSTTPTTTNLLNPTESNIALTAEQDLVITYTFTAVETYYATLEYKDNTTNASNIEFSYALNDEGYTSKMSMPIEVTPDHSTTYSIKLHIANTARNANLSGSLNWALTKEGSQAPSGGDNIETVSLSYANNEGSVVNSDTVTFKKNADGTKFKIVGPTPIIDSTSTTSYLNGSFNERTTTATGKVASIDDLTNRNGAEFYYFCTNQAVVGSTGYNDPGTIYYTSTADSTLESWYDLPDSNTNLYACFMTPNYTSEALYTGSDTQIVISNKVTNILYKAFYDKSSITDVVIPQSVKNIGYGTSNTSYGAFEGCSNLKSVTIPNSVTSIGRYAFSSCSGLTSITIPNSVTSIEVYAFYGCSGLTSITIPNSVTSIESDAFRGCSGLTSVTIGSGVTSIGDAFDSCSGLTSITVSENNTTYRSSGNCLIKKSDNSLILGCKTSVIPNSVTSIGDYAFKNCSGLTSITIPKSVTSIAVAAFLGCRGLTSITIPDSVTKIDQSAFYLEGLSSDSSTMYYSGTQEQFSNLTHYNTFNSVFNGCYDMPKDKKLKGSIKVITSDVPAGFIVEICYYGIEPPQI